jgi:tetratricopeptide (TPR) repeat protein
VWLPLAAAAGGCKLAGYEGPVSQSLATCRQYSQRGVAAMEQGQAREAEQWLAKAVKSCPSDPEARRHYGEALWKRGAGAEAVVQMQEAARRARDDAGIQVRLAEMQTALGDLAAAQQHVNRAIDLNPKLPAAWATRARMERTAGQLREALADYHRALGYAPDDAGVLIEVAEVYRQLNQPQRALQTLQGLAETYTPGEEPPQVLHLMGIAYVNLGRHDDAVETLGAAVLRGNPSPDLYYHLAEAELLAGHPNEATAAAQQALALEPAHRPSRELLGRVEIARNPQAPTLR